MSGSSFTNIFGGSVVRPSQPSYLAYTLSATTQFYWPLETTESVPVLASQIDVTATDVTRALRLPPGNTGSTGIASLISNVGSNAFDVTDVEGNVIVNIDTSEAWVVTLTNNSTTAGTWRVYQLGATTSSAEAGALAGAGLQAFETRLRTTILQTELSVPTTIGVDYRAKSIVWTGGTDTVQLDDITKLSNGWFCGITNSGTGVLTVTTTSSQLINGESTLIVNPGNSGFIIAGDTEFNTVGVLIGPLEVVNGGTGADTATEALTNLGGTTIGKSIFTAPNAAAVRAIIGLTYTNFYTVVVSTDQTLTPSQASSMFVSTASLTLTLPAADTVDVGFVFAALCRSGTLSIAIDAGDQLNGASAGVGTTIPVDGYMFFCTDGIDQWYAFGGPKYALSGGLTAGSITTGGTVAATGAISTASSLSVGGTGTVTGLFTAGNINTGGTLNVTGLLTAGNIYSAGTILTAGNATVANLTTAGTVAASGNISGNTITGNYLNSSGTITASGNITGNNINASGTMAATGVISASNGTSSSQVVNFSQFPQVLSTPNMYVGVPTAAGSRVMFQAGTGTTDGSGNGTITYNVAFTTGCLACVPVSVGLDILVRLNAAPGASSVAVTSVDMSGTPVAATFVWIAMGY